MPLFHMQGAPIGAIAVLLALVASIGGFIFGYDTGQISDILVMDDFKQRFATCTNPSDPNSCTFSVVREGLIVALLSIGTLIGAILGAPIADGLGRRKAMIIECLVFIVGVIIQITTGRNWIQVALGRLVSGLGVGALSAVVPVYQAETAPPPLRGTLTATYQLFITLGILTAYCIAIGTRELPGSKSWVTVIGIGIIWPSILISGMLVMPESPRWLAKKGRIEEAEQSVARTFGITKKDELHYKRVKQNVMEMTNQIEYEKRIQAGWLDCFKPQHKILYRTLLGMTMQSLQQLTGANYFFYYGATIFKSVGISDSFVTQIILGAVNCVCTFGGLYVMERFGRRRPLICGGLWQSLWLFIFASAGTARDPQSNKTVGTLMIVSACMFILGFATTWAPGVWIITGETFPQSTRAKQSALSTSSNWTFNFLIAFFTPFITRAIQFRYGFVFAACNLAGAIIVYLFLYESSDLSLEAVDQMYNDPNCKPWNSASWVPIGSSSRNKIKNKNGEAGNHNNTSTNSNSGSTVVGSGDDDDNDNEKGMGMGIGMKKLNGNGNVLGLGGGDEERVEVVDGLTKGVAGVGGGVGGFTVATAKDVGLEDATTPEIEALGHGNRGLSLGAVTGVGGGGDEGNLTFSSTATALNI